MKTWFSQYKEIYKKVLKENANLLDTESLNESAIPSYTHPNPLMSWFFWQRIKVVFRLLEKIDNKKVLDFGTGSGVLLKYLDGKNCEVTACDVNTFYFLEQIIKNFSLNSKITKNIMEISEEKFDYIIALDVLEHIADIEIYINKFADLSKGETKIIISGPTESFLYKIGRKLAGFSGDYHVQNIYSVEDFFIKKGLKKQKLIRLYFPFTLFRISVWCF